MKILQLSTLILIFQISTVSAQKTFIIDGVEVPRTLEFMDAKLSLNGGGTIAKASSNGFVQALYLSQLRQDPKFIIADNSEMGMRIQITSSGLSSTKLIKIFNESFQKSLGKKIDDFKPEIEKFNNCLVGEIEKGDVLKLMYSSTDTSVSVFKNDKLKGKIKGINFKKALFGIWLSDKPIDEKLKNHLLGK
ncbi:chalcone isomerase family protein [Flavobacterium sp. FlaQc-48]|uniref:chalcone isomerase family protein n=1 Tax=Flavobacterium sp. FlaQc-48 TaxID=3374181 RepID=UPI00375737E3